MGFYLSDDFLDDRITTLFDAFRRTAYRYMNWGGALLSTFCQCVFCGLLRSHKIWFDIVNTCAFALLLFSAGSLITNDRKRILGILLFALVFWFFCPAPNQSLFWVVGSTAYLWTHSLAFLFLLVYEKNKDKAGSFWYQWALFVFSIFAASSLIPCVSICGAFVVYYFFHFKEYKGNCFPLVIGFILGSAILVFAPGNFIRASADPGAVEHFSLFRHPLGELLKYRVLWVFVVAWFWGIWKDKGNVIQWTRNNLFLLLTLIWSVVALSIVFSPARRAWLFTETLSMVLLLRFLFSINWQRISEKWSDRLSRSGKYLLPVALVLFLIDTGFAVRETLRQKENNRSSLALIRESDGITGVDKFVTAHRMANTPSYPVWAWKGMAMDLHLDSVRVYPYYCQDKYYGSSPLGENVYFDEEGLLCTDDFYDTLSDECVAVIRCKESEIHLPVRIDVAYSRPHKWYRKWWDRIKGYEYDRSAVLERMDPDVVFKGYAYYVVYLKKENTLKSIELSCN